MSADHVVFDEHMTHLFAAVGVELSQAVTEHGFFHSMHEALAVLEEEVHEFRLEVYKKRGERDRKRMMSELVQVAAVSIKTILTLQLENNPKTEVPA